MEATGLLLVDIQNDYFPGGAMEVEGSEAVGVAARRLLDFFRERRGPIVHVQHVSTRRGATFFLPDTPGAEIHTGVRPLGDEPVIVKHYPNCFRETDLLARLQQAGVKTLVIAGMMTHMCIDATARAAADLGFECSVVADACGARSLTLGGRSVAASDVQAAFLAALHGAYGRVIEVDPLLQRLTTRA
jgi:nicotinamidase-related amidase